MKPLADWSQKRTSSLACISAAPRGKPPMASPIEGLETALVPNSTARRAPSASFSSLTQKAWLSPARTMGCTPASAKAA